MATSEYAKNLAKALFEDAAKENELIRWLGELRLVSDVVKDKSVSSALQKPGFSFEEQSKLQIESGACSVPSQHGFCFSHEGQIERQIESECGE